MSETNMWALVRPSLIPLDPIRIEYRQPGLPDVNFCDGWIELKCIKDYPTRPSTSVRVWLYRKEQRAWHVRRSLAGGNIWVLLQIAYPNDWLLFRGDVAAQKLGFVTREELFRVAVGRWFNKVPPKNEICKLLRERPKKKKPAAPQNVG